jgi:prevent-host-death family protein
MSETIRQSDLRNNNAEIMRRVSEGETFSVTVHGRVVADIVPHQRDRSRRRLLPAAELDALIAASGPAPVPGQWERDMTQFDGLVDDRSVDPWQREADR